MKSFLPEQELKKRLIWQAQIHDGYRVLDLGAGTGTLTILMGQMHPQALLVGLDGDAEILERARQKGEVAGVEIQWDQGSACELPYADNTFDRVVSSLMFHHLAMEDKVNALWEAWRVLRPGGELHILDFGRPHTLVARAISSVVRHAEETSDEIDGLLPDMLQQAGFRDVGVMEQRMTIFGTMSLYRGVKLDSAGPRVHAENIMAPGLARAGHRLDTR